MNQRYARKSERKKKKRKKKDSDRKLTFFLTLDITPKEMFDRRTVSQSQTAIETR